MRPGLISKPEGFDVQIMKKADMYFVSGKSAADLHDKLMQVPVEVRDLDVSPLKSGQFTMRKVTPPYMMGAVS